jgi:hypothetical protein
MIFPVQLHDVEEARRYNQVATEQDFSIYISCDNVTIDVRSILGLLTMIGGVAVRVFKNQIGESIDRMVYNLKVSTGLVKKETDKMRDETLKALTSFGG